MEASLMNIRCPLTYTQAQSASIAFLDLIKSTAGITLLLLQTFTNIAKLSGNTTYSNNNSTIIATGLTVLSLFCTDAYVHYRIYSHQRYNENDEDSANYLSGIETGATVTSAVDSAKQTLLDPVQYSQANYNTFSWSAFFCTVGCSLDTAWAPTPVISLLRYIGLLSEESQTLSWVGLISVVVTGGICAWTAPRRYNLAKKHLQNQPNTVDTSEKEHKEQVGARQCGCCNKPGLGTA